MREVPTSKLVPPYSGCEFTESLFDSLLVGSLACLAAAWVSIWVNRSSSLLPTTLHTINKAFGIRVSVGFWRGRGDGGGKGARGFPLRYLLHGDRYRRDAES